MSSLRIHRYLVSEISVPTLLSLVIFSFVLLLSRIPRLMEMIINQGVPAGDMLALFGFLLPTFLSVTLPMSFLLGILIAFGRISADSEYIALKASGVSLWSLMQPVVVLALLFTLATAAITLAIEPMSKAAFRGKLYEVATTSLSVSLKPGVFNTDFPDLVLYAQGVDERRGIMENVFISDERHASAPTTITARSGRLVGDPQSQRLTLRLEQGDIHRQGADSAGDDYQTVRFGTYDINLNLGEQLNSSERRRSRSELSWQQLRRKIQSLPAGNAKNRLLVEWHERIVIACAPLVLILVGVPLGLQSQRSGKGAGFALALMIFLVYYVLLSLAGTLAEENILPAAVILWLPNLVFLTAGSFFLYRSACERPVRAHLDLWQFLVARWRNLTRKQ